MGRRVVLVALFASVLAAVLVTAREDAGQPITPIDALLRTQLAASTSDLRELSAGRPLVVTLDASARHEMTTAGAIRIRGASIDGFVERYRSLEGFKTSSFILQIGHFASEPALADLEPLTLEAQDLDSLRECRVGDCDVQLSAADIRRVAGVDWRAPAARREAAALYKRILYDHLQEYRAGGIDRLITYAAKAQPVPLASELRALVDVRPSLLERLPTLHDYVRRFPAAPALPVHDFFYWSKEAFGFKPVVGLHHVSILTDPARGETQIVTRQIYASHYIHCLLSVSALIPDGSSPDSGFYWIYVNRSRVGPLGGFLGTLSRPIVQRRARQGLARSLVQTQQRIEGRSPAAAKN